MGKLNAFVRLDFLTAKPGLSSHATLIYAVLLIIITVFTRNIIVAVFQLMAFANNFAVMPFSIGEARNMDALYPTLNIDRKTVVKGRYIYVLTILILGVVGALLVAWGGLHLENALSTNLHSRAALGSIAAFTLMTILNIATQLPLHFKLGLAKSGAWTSIPNIVLMLIPLFLFSMFYTGRISEWISEFLANPLLLWTGITGVILVLAVVVYVSYRLSVRFYTNTKREF